jgi:hypothetical protein
MCSALCPRLYFDVAHPVSSEWYNTALELVDIPTFINCIGEYEDGEKQQSLGEIVFTTMSLPA